MPLCPFCRCELQITYLTDLETGWINGQTIDCLNPECPREELTQTEVAEVLELTFRGSR